MTSIRQSASNAISNPEQRKSSKSKRHGDHGYESSSSSKRRDRRKYKSRLDGKQQKFAAMTIVVLTIVIFTAMVTSPYHQNVPKLKIENLNGHSRDGAHSLDVNHKKDNRVYNKNCVLVKAVQSDHPVTPIFTASFPGSGSKLFWQLIEALTGLKTGDDYTATGDSNFVSIKTHYPSHEGRLIPKNGKIPHTILLVRHPMYAFFAYFRRLYRHLNQSPDVNYPPLEKWIEWRNDNFDRQLQVWRRHTEYWMDHYSKTDRLVITYEKLVDEKYGADEALRVAEFLDRSEGVHVPPDDVPCVWRKIIKPKKSLYHGRRLVEVESIDEVKKSGVEGIKNETVQIEGGDIAVVHPEVGTESVVSGNTPDVNEKMKKEDVSAEAKISAKGVKSTEIKYIAPFNKRQLKDVIQILTQLLERYRDDKALAPILVSYIDEVAQRSERALIK